MYSCHCFWQINSILNFDNNQLTTQQTIPDLISRGDKLQKICRQFTISLLCICVYKSDKVWFERAYIN